PESARDRRCLADAELGLCGAEDAGDGARARGDARDQRRRRRHHATRPRIHEPGARQVPAVVRAADDVGHAAPGGVSHLHPGAQSPQSRRLGTDGGLPAVGPPQPLRSPQPPDLQRRSSHAPQRHQRPRLVLEWGVDVSSLLGSVRRPAAAGRASFVETRHRNPAEAAACARAAASRGRGRLDRRGGTGALRRHRRVRVLQHQRPQ
ncbi:MAG: hypothetical protein QOE82_2377, partial [Thermoanaerobaculia bacterium]|nr:hypothetical protein [Thermoanaerobaculia bacterium]